MCHHRLGQTRLALRDYSVVLLLEKTVNFVVHLNRAVLYFEDGDYANALADLLVLLGAPGLGGDAWCVWRGPGDDPSNKWRGGRVMHAVALCRHRTGDLVGAVAGYTRLLATNPEFSEALLARGNAYMDYGHVQVGWGWIAWIVRSRLFPISRSR